jgi:hypothetical protein
LNFNPGRDKGIQNIPDFIPSDMPEQASWKGLVFPYRIYKRYWDITVFEAITGVE